MNCPRYRSVRSRIWVQLGSKYKPLHAFNGATLFFRYRVQVNLTRDLRCGVPQQGLHGSYWSIYAIKHRRGQKSKCRVWCRLNEIGEPFWPLSCTQSCTREAFANSSRHFKCYSYNIVSDNFCVADNSLGIIRTPRTAKTGLHPKNQRSVTDTGAASPRFARHSRYVSHVFPWATSNRYRPCLLT